MTDELWPGGPRFKDAAGFFRLGADSILLASFVKIKRAARVMELGCGSGIISILLSWNNPALRVDGIEINPLAAKAARENLEHSALSGRVRIIDGDLREHRAMFKSGEYDLVVSNPPYYARGKGKRASNEAIAAARGEESCTISDICRAASYLTRQGGAFALVHKPERLPEIFAALTNTGLEPKRIRLVQHNLESAPNLALIEARRGGKPSLSIEPTLILTNNDGSDSDEVRAIYHI